MKVSSGFDKRNTNLYRWLLSGFALASALMLTVALLGKSAESSPGRLHAILWPSVAFITAAWGYNAAKKSKQSFHYVGAAGTTFALALYGFGMTVQLSLLVGVPSFLGALVSLGFKDKVDVQVEDDDF